MKKAIFTFCAFAFLTILSCKKESSSTTTTTTSSGGTTNTTKASADITTETTSGEKKAGYSVLVFEQAFSPTQVMPPVLMQAKTNTQGNVVFDLESSLGGAASKTYYFEAFVQNSNGSYTLKSIIRTVQEIKKDTKTTTAIIVE